MKHKTIYSGLYLPVYLQKDLRDNEDICEVCGGTGVIKNDYIFYCEAPGGIEKTPAIMKKYNNEHLTLCPNCYFGVIKKCKYCGKILNKMSIRCNCEGYQEKEKLEYDKKYNELLTKAKEVFPNEYCNEEVLYSGGLYDDIGEFGGYYFDIEDFIGEYKELYKGRYSSLLSFDEFFEEKVPKVLWICEKHELSIDAYSIVEQACEELYEDAIEQIQDIHELQSFLNEWTKKQTGTTTYYPAYKKYIKVRKEWFKNGFM